MSVSLLALLTPPLTVLPAGRRLSDGAPLALVVTVVVTWCVAVALGLLLGGVDDIAAILMFVFVVLPMIGSLVAAGIAARLVHGRGLFVSALALALVGWYAGLTVMMLLEPSGALSVNPRCPGRSWPQCWSLGALSRRRGAGRFRA